MELFKRRAKFDRLVQLSNSLNQIFSESTINHDKFIQHRYLIHGVTYLLAKSWAINPKTLQLTDGKSIITWKSKVVSNDMLYGPHMFDLEIDIHTCRSSRIPDPINTVILLYSETEYCVLFVPKESISLAADRSTWKNKLAMAKMDEEHYEYLVEPTMYQQNLGIIGELTKSNSVKRSKVTGYVSDILTFNEQAYIQYLAKLFK